MSRRHRKPRRLEDLSPEEREFYAGFKQIYPPRPTLEIGSRVRIVGDHPHAGRVGTVKDVQKLVGKPALLVRFDDGDGCFVFEKAHIRILPTGSAARSPAEGGEG